MSALGQKRIAANWGEAMGQGRLGYRDDECTCLIYRECEDLRLGARHPVDHVAVK
jgi:hypothetical protein